MISIALPLWLRIVSLIAVVVAVSAASLFGYRYYTHPVTLTLAVGSIDGGGAKAMSEIASELVAFNAPVRLKVVDSGTASDAARLFAAGNVDLAVVRADVGDLSKAQAVVVLANVTALLVAPPGSPIDSVDKLKGRTVGVVGGDLNARVVAALTKEYDLGRAKVVFKNIALTDLRHAVDSHEANALLFVIPLTEKYLSLVRDLYPHDAKSQPVLIPIEAAGAIAGADRAYESFDVPKGTLRGAPPVPSDDLTTLRTSLYLVAHRKLDTDVVTGLTRAVMRARRVLLAEQPVFAQITAPSTDADALLPVHPGAAAFFNGTQLSFMDKYSNYIYMTPMVLGGIASVLAAAWKFLGIGNPETVTGPLDSLYSLARRIRSSDKNAELAAIEDEIDNILNAERVKAASGDESAVDNATLNVVAHRLENLIHDRRIILASSHDMPAA
ncbi:MAG: TAXI family TRAP transporter solute-binding subunit [Xanthobacteraceae bacterium]